MADLDTNNKNSLMDAFFIKRILGILIVAGTVLGGLISYQSMTREDNPDLAIPIVMVQTTWPGRDPLSIEKQITNKLEEQIKTVEGVKKYESASFNSASIIKIEFDIDQDVDTCVQRLSSKLDAVSDLPDDAFKPVIEKKTVNDTPVLTINLYGDINASKMNKLANDFKDQLLKTNGIQKVEISGERKDRIFVLLKNEQLISLNISPLMVMDAIQKAHKDTSLEAIESETFSPQIKIFGMFRSVDDLKHLTITHVGDYPVLLKDIAEVRRDLEQEKTRIRLSDQGGEYRDALSVNIYRAPNSDTVRLVGDSLKILDEMKVSNLWLPGVDTKVTTNNAIDINESLDGVIVNVIQAIVLVFIVLFFALTWRESIVAGLSIPIALFATLTVANMVGYTLNSLVIIGMVLALGMMVDVFILMMEGMHENLFEHKKSFRESVFATVKTYALPAFSGQLTTIFAFLPLTLMGGIDGKFIRIIPIVVSICLFLSFLIALFVDLPLSWYVFKSVKPDHKTGKIDKLTKKAEGFLSAFLSKFIVPAKGRATLVLTIAVALFGLSLYTMTYINQEMYPKSDAMDMGITVDLDPESTLADSDKVAKELGEILRQESYFDSVVAYSGMRSPTSGGAAMKISKSFSLVGYSCRMKTLADREGKYSFEYVEKLREKLNKKLDDIAPGARLSIYVNTGGTSGAAPVEIRLFHEDLDVLRKSSIQTKEILSSIPGARDVEDNLGAPKFTIESHPNYEALSFYNINASTFGAQMRFATGTDKIASMPDDRLKEEPEIRLGYYWPSRQGLPGGPMTTEELMALRIFVSDQNLPFQALSRPEPKQDAQSIVHFDGNRAAVVSAYNGNRGADLILKDFKEQLSALDKESWNDSVQLSYGGESEQSGESSATGPLFIALFMVFAVLSLQFGSFKQPFIIMMSLPLAFSGIIYGYFFTGMAFSFVAMVGAISMVGIAVNDAIVMVETMNGCREKGMSVKDAAAKGSAMRLRPIIVTTLTTILGLIPLAFSDPTWMPLCMSIIFGLLAATVVSFFVIPALYLLLTKETEA